MPVTDKAVQDELAKEFESFEVRAKRDERTCLSVRRPLTNQSRNAAHFALSTTRFCAPPGVACTPASRSSACSQPPRLSKQTFMQK